MCVLRTKHIEKQSFVPIFASRQMAVLFSLMGGPWRLFTGVKMSQAEIEIVFMWMWMENGKPLTAIRPPKVFA